MFAKLAFCDNWAQMNAVPRLYAGYEVRSLRQQLGLTQGVFSRKYKISVSYLCQIESGDRPLPQKLLGALLRDYPQSFQSILPEMGELLELKIVDAAADPSIQGHILPPAEAQRALRKSPHLGRRLIAVYDGYVRAIEQTRILDERIDAHATSDGTLPWEEIRDWFHAKNNYIDDLDKLGESLFDINRPVDVLLKEKCQIQVKKQRLEDKADLMMFSDATSKTLYINSILPKETQDHLIASHLMVHVAEEIIESILQNAGLSSETSLNILRVGLVNYAAAALRMPYEEFRRSAKKRRHDIDALTADFSVSFEQACHRLSTLQRDRSMGMPVFFCRVDMAGNITKRHSATKFQFARYGGACPLWIMHEAVCNPDRILAHHCTMPDNSRFVVMAKGLIKKTNSYVSLPRRYAVSLGCAVEHATDFVYADHIDTKKVDSATPIGPSCRVCPRENCQHRAFPPVGQAIELDRHMRTIVPYKVKQG